MILQTPRGNIAATKSSPTHSILLLRPVVDPPAQIVPRYMEQGPNREEAARIRDSLAIIQRCGSKAARVYRQAEWLTNSRSKRSRTRNLMTLMLMNGSQWLWRSVQFDLPFPRLKTRHSTITNSQHEQYSSIPRVCLRLSLLPCSRTTA